MSCNIQHISGPQLHHILSLLPMSTHNSAYRSGRTGLGPVHFGRRTRDGRSQ